MRRRAGRYDCSIIPIVIALTLLVVLPAALPDLSVDGATIDTFSDGGTSITLGFREVSGNTTATIELPKGCTVGTASVVIEGLSQRGDDVRSLDLSNFGPLTPHRAWRGWIQGGYPPSYPIWDPYSPRGTAFTASDYSDVGASDDTRLRTGSTNQMTNRYPFHIYRFALPSGTLTGLSVEWEGFGYCLANATTRGAEVFLWKNGSRAWERVDWYSKTEPAQDRLLTKAFTTNFDRYVDDDDQVFIVVLGKRSQNVAGPNPWTAEGELQTDYIRVNATLEGGWEEATNVALSVGAGPAIWNKPGPLTTQVTIDDGDGLGTAIQEVVDASPIEPGNVTVPILVNVSKVTAALVRLSSLEVTYEPLVNSAPSWGSVPPLTMDEDVDARKLLDLSTVAYDDYSHGRLVYQVVYTSTGAVQARIDERRFLSVLVVEPNWFGSATFQVNATDLWGLSTTSPIIQVDVEEVNDGPIVTDPGRQRGTQGETFVYHVEATDVDGDSLGFSIDTEAFAIDAATGEINFTPTNDHVGLHKVNVTVDDGRGGSAVVRMELEVLNVNDPPVIEDPGPLEGRQDDVFMHSFVVIDLDLIHGDQLTWVILGDDFYRTNLLLNPLTGVLEWHSIGNSDVGVHSFTVQVTDSQGEVDQVDIILEIANVNDPPSFMRIPDLLVFEDGHLDYSIKVTDPDLDVDPGEELTWEVDPPLFEVASTGTFSFVPSRNEVGVYLMLVSVTDRMGESYDQTFTMTVKEINHPPTISHIPDQTAMEDQPWSLVITVADQDPGDSVELTARGAPFNVPSTGGLIQWMAEERHGGEHLVTLEATDLSGAKATFAFNLTVVTFNDPPVVVILTPYQGEVFPYDSELDIRASVSDEEGDDVHIVWSWRFNDTPNQPWERLNTGAAVFWPDPPDGPIRLKVEATDGHNTTSQEVVFLVRSPPDEGGIGGATLIALMVLLVLVAVVLLFVMRGRVGDDGGKEAPEEPAEEEESWDEVPPEEEKDGWREY
jgi:hypothetical protein